MYIRLLVKLLMGYVRIEVEGYYIERFINICTNRKILIWNLKREKGVKLYLNIGINDFKNISDILKKTNCKVRILKKRGIPFLLNRYKKRKIFVILLVIMMFTIYASSRYIWNIDITVKNNLQIDNLEEDLESLGVKKGIKKDEIDTNKIINELRLKRDDIAWIGIDIEGTSIKINIVKADKSPDIVKNTDYCNIIASKSGVIQKIVAQNGTAVVKIGDEVQKGDILIAGYMEGKYTDTRYVHSLGEVKAIVTYEETKEIRFNQDIYNYTGNEEKKYEISINNWKIKLHRKNSKFELYETKIENKDVKLFGKYYLPLEIIQITNREQIKESKVYSREEAIDLGKDILSSELEQKIENKEDIVDKKMDIEEFENSVVVTVKYGVLENIGENQKIE